MTKKESIDYLKSEIKEDARKFAIMYDNYKEQIDTLKEQSVDGEQMYQYGNLNTMLEYIEDSLYHSIVSLIVAKNELGFKENLLRKLEHGE